ncbi:MAG TPA: glycosyltransferase [Hyphomicrobiaceae bacterium]|nr:glycosyltransferase [Hyphomicrobiaceae bacterium]
MVTLRNMPNRIPRRIVMYIHNLSGGGAERIWAVVASGLASVGHDVLLVTDDEAAENKAVLDPAVRTKVLRGSHVATVAKLSRILRRERADVALAAVSGSNFKLALAKAAALTRTPIVISYHGFWEHKTGWLGWLGCVSMAALSRFAARTIAVSDGLRNELVAKWHSSPDRTLRIYNPIGVPDAPEITAADLAARPELVLCVGRLIEDKDIGTVLRAFARLDRPTARLLILGEGPDRAMLETLAARLGIADRVSMPGYVLEPWVHYSKARCLVHGAKQEAFGNIIVEALAYGLPVVTTACAGPSEILGRGRFGTVVPIGDDRALAAGLAAALDDPGDPGPRRARAVEFALAPGIAGYETLIETVIAEHCSSRRVGVPAPQAPGSSVS